MPRSEKFFIGCSAAPELTSVFRALTVPGGDANAFSEKARQKDSLLVPGDGFGCPGYFHICCVSIEIIQKSLPVFKKLIGF